MVKLTEDAERWHIRAEQARMLADTAASQEVKRSFLAIAATYEKLAELATARLKRERLRSPDGQN
jgi:hypothetical protein